MTRLPVILLAGLALTGCVALERDVVGEKENQLAAAGFTILPASSKERQDMLGRIPPNSLTQVVQGDRVTYLYADPVRCHCLYAGGQQAFGQYQAYRLQRRIADEQVTAAQLNTNYGWDWGPWGGYGGWR